MGDGRGVVDAFSAGMRGKTRVDPRATCLPRLLLLGLQLSSGMGLRLRLQLPSRRLPLLGLLAGLLGRGLCQAEDVRKSRQPPDAALRLLQRLEPELPLLQHRPRPELPELQRLELSRLQRPRPERPLLQRPQPELPELQRLELEL